MELFSLMFVVCMKSMCKCAFMQFFIKTKNFFFRFDIENENDFEIIGM